MGVGDGQGGLAYCDSWGRKESDTTERLNRTEQRDLMMTINIQKSHSNPKSMCTKTTTNLETMQNKNGETRELHKSTIHCQFSSVTQSCPTLCNPMNHGTPGLPVHHHLPEFTQTHVHRVSDAIQPISPSVILFSSCPQSFPASGSFQMSQLFASGVQSIGVSASTSVLPKNTQD